MDKTLPHNLDAERAVLAAMLMDNGAMARGLSILSAEYFYSSAHSKIFDAFTALANIENAAVDITSLVEQLRVAGNMEAIGGPAYLIELSQSVATSANIEYHASMVLDKYRLRKVIKDANALMEAAYGEKDTPNALIDGFLSECSSLSLDRSSGLKHIMQYISPAMEEIEAIVISKVSKDAVKTGYHDFDFHYGGLPKSELTTLASRTSVGKTSLALNIAQNVAMSGTCVAFFSLEMSGNQLASRALCSQASVSLDRAKRGYINKEEMQELVQAGNAFYSSPLYIDDDAIQSVNQVRAKAKALHAEIPIGLVVVDHIQFVQAAKGRRDATRAEDVSGITRGLKALAKELGCSVLAISHLRRSMDGKDDSVPKMSELKESGSIEQDSGMVLFLHRERTQGEIKPETEFIIAKNRTGRVGVVHLFFQSEYTRFDSVARDRSEENYTDRDSVEAGTRNLPF